MTTLIYPPAIEIGSECRACALGAGDFYCECLDENRCYGCNEKIAWQYDVTVGDNHYHRYCAALLCAEGDCEGHEDDE